MVLHHHLGLGDHFVCNGLVNHLACERREVIHLPCKKHNYDTVAYLYSENQWVRPFSIEGRNEVIEVETFAKQHSEKVLRVGFEKCNKKRWDRSFYEQLGIDFVERYRHFKLPRKKPDKMLPVPAGDFILLSNKGSTGEFNLRISSRNEVVRVLPMEGYHLLCYLDLIMSAEEIHCIDSSVFHLIDGIPNTTDKLYFHDARPSSTRFDLSPKWAVVHY